MGLRMKYFVLKPHGRDYYAIASRAAMKTYAYAIRQEDKQLSSELLAWISREQVDAENTHPDFIKTCTHVEDACSVCCEDCCRARG